MISSQADIQLLSKLRSLSESNPWTNAEDTGWTGKHNIIGKSNQNTKSIGEYREEFKSRSLQGKNHRGSQK